MPLKNIDKEKVLIRKRNDYYKNRARYLLKRKENYHQNIKREKIYRKNYYKTHLNELRKKQQEYKLKNKDKRREANQIYYKNNKKIILDQQRNKRLLNPEIFKAKRRNYRSQNLIRIRSYERNYRELNRDKLNEWHRKYRKTKRKSNPYYALELKIRKRIWHALKGKKMKDIEEYGVSPRKIAAYIRSIANEDQINNPYKYHIDHIKPLCSFNLNDPEEIKKAFAPENHQWLLVFENLSKGSKSVEEWEKQKFKPFKELK